jgi:pilus assembly protein Flp/PilA
LPIIIPATFSSGREFATYNEIKGDSTMTRFFDRLMINEEGATMVEYAIMLALIGAALVASLNALSTAISGKFTTVSTTLGGS